MIHHETLPLRVLRVGGREGSSAANEGVVSNRA